MAEQLIPETRDARLNRETKKRLIVEAIRGSGVISKGCRAAKVPRSTFKHWRNEDEDFAARVIEAMEDFRDSLNDAATKRGRDGIDEPVIHQGRLMFALNPDGSTKLDDDFEPIPLTIKRHSDNLLGLQLKALDPRYKDKASLEVSGPDGGPLEKNITVTYVLPKGKTIEDYEEKEDDRDTGEPVGTGEGTDDTGDRESRQGKGNDSYLD